MQQIQLPPLAEGEVYLAGFVDANGDVTHTILMPNEAADLTWQKALDWAKSIGGDLPTRAELVIAYEKKSDLFQEDAYWSNQADTDPGYTSYAWYQDFDSGYQYGCREDRELRARAVRRLTI